MKYWGIKARSLANMCWLCLHAPPDRSDTQIL